MDSAPEWITALSTVGLLVVAVISLWKGGGGDKR